MPQKRAWIVLLGWVPPIYLVGIIRNWGKPWCTWDGGFFPISSPIPVFWWPTKLYQHRKRGGW